MLKSHISQELVIVEQTCLSLSATSPASIENMEAMSEKEDCLEIPVQVFLRAHKDTVSEKVDVGGTFTDEA